MYDLRPRSHLTTAFLGGGGAKSSAEGTNIFHSNVQYLCATCPTAPVLSSYPRVHVPLTPTVLNFRPLHNTDAETFSGLGPEKSLKWGQLSKAMARQEESLLPGPFANPVLHVDVTFFTLSTHTEL
jgi:hypothetical protein